MNDISPKSLRLFGGPITFVLTGEINSPFALRGTRRAVRGSQSRTVTEPQRESNTSDDSTVCTASKCYEVFSVKDAILSINSLINRNCGHYIYLHCLHKVINDHIFIGLMDGAVT